MMLTRLLIISVLIQSKFQIMCRCKHPVSNSVKDKVSLFCHVPPEQVGYVVAYHSKAVPPFKLFWSAKNNNSFDGILLWQVIDVHDCKSIYRVPLLLLQQGIVSLIAKRLQVEVKSPVKPRHFMAQWKELAERYVNLFQRAHKEENIDSWPYKSHHWALFILTKHTNNMLSVIEVDN